MKISVIIPVYNAKKYLRRCLESVIESMGDKDGEIIAIDNNSSDDSLCQLEDFGRKYPKLIKIFRYDKPGAAAVRNFGVKKARGEYIWFIDADDEIAKDSISKLLSLTNETRADLIMFGMKRIYPNGGENYLSAVMPNEKKYKSRFVRYGLGPVQVLIKRDWWQKNNFRFHEGIIHEDMELMSALIINTDKYEAIDEPLYYYYQNEDSVLHKKQFDPHIFDIFTALSGLYQRFEEAGVSKIYREELEWFFIWNLLIDSASDFAKFPEGKEGFSRSRRMLKQYFPNWRRNKFLRQKPLRLQLKIYLNYLK